MSTVAVVDAYGIRKCVKRDDGRNLTLSLQREDCYSCFDADDPDNFNCDLIDASDPENPVPGTDGILDSYCGDGYPDLIVKFDAQALADAIGEADRDECVVLTLTALTRSGDPIEASDSMVIKTKIKD